MTSLMGLRDKILKLYSVPSSILIVLFKGADQEPGQEVVKPSYSEFTAVAEVPGEEEPQAH